MFKRFFVFTTFTVLFCLVVSSLSLMFFFADFWKNDRFASLSDDALSLTRSVEALCEKTGGDFQSAYENEDLMHIVTDSISSVAEKSGENIFVADIYGNPILYESSVSSDKYAQAQDTDSDSLSFCISGDVLKSAYDSFPQAYTGSGQLNDNDKSDYFYAVVPIYVSDKICGFAVAMQTVENGYKPFMTEFIRILIKTILTAVLFSFVVSLFSSFRMVKPLKKMTATTKKYASGNFEERIKSVDTYSELSEFVEAFNSMAESLAVTEESRSSFVANISHELKTPMTIISGFVDGILDGTIPPDDRDRYLEIVSGETKRLSRLVVSMLNMSKIEAGKLKVSPVDIHLADMLCEIIIGFEKSVNDKKIDIAGLDTLKNVSAYADDALINQVFYNLIDNAIKFTPENGKITFDITEEKKYAVISIKNTGKGIPKDECELVFDRFYKLDKSRGLDAGSFGLGLHIVKSIIELHNGTITVNSEPDEYTEFVVKLPTEKSMYDF